MSCKVKFLSEKNFDRRLNIMQKTFRALMSLSNIQSERSRSERSCHRSFHNLRTQILVVVDYDRTNVVSLKE